MKNITIVGGGTAGWISACIIAKSLAEKPCSISLIESPDIASVGVGEATIPPILELIRYLEIPQQQIIEKCSATFKYGIDFQDWNRPGHRYMHAFGLMNSRFNQSQFTNLWLQFRESLQLPHLNAFSPTAIAGLSNRFHPPQTLPEGASDDDYYPLSQLYYAFQFDASKLAELLKEYAIKLGVNYISGTVTQVNATDKEGVTSLILDDDLTVTAELFIDCTGTRASLIGSFTDNKFIDYQQYLPCDRAVVAQSKVAEPLYSYTKSIAMQYGWRWQIPLQKRCGNGYVYASDFVTEEQACAELVETLGEENLVTEPRTIKFRTGHLSKPWHHNVVAIGLSAGFFEPLESTSIHMIQKYVFTLEKALSAHFDESIDLEASRGQFNVQYHQDAEHIRDFLMLHYRFNERADTKFWQHCQQLPMPASLQDKLREYQTSGQISLSDSSVFPYQSWLQVLTGQEVYPENLNKNDLSISKQQAYDYFVSINQAIKQQVSSLPSADSYLRELLLSG